MANTIRIKAPDFAELRRDLEAVDFALGRELGRIISDAAEPIRGVAEQFAPFDPTHRGHRGDADDPGHIRDSLHLRPAPYGAALVTSHPGAAPHEYGGDIAPRGTPFHIEAKRFAERAGEAKEDVVADRVDLAIERLLAQHNL